MNTVEAFKVALTAPLPLNLIFHFLQAVDKAAFLQQEGQRLWDNILQGCCEKDSDTLAWCGKSFNQRICSKFPFQLLNPDVCRSEEIPILLLVS